MKKVIDNMEANLDAYAKIEQDIIKYKESNYGGKI